MAAITAGAAKRSRRLGLMAAWPNRSIVSPGAPATVRRLRFRGVNLLVPGALATGQVLGLGGTVMKRFSIIAAVLLTCAAAVGFTSRAENTSIKGDYVEVRTASVFAGACHFNGEVVTAGREAIMAWNFAAGRWNGTDLTGLKAMAVISADENLENSKAARRAEIVLDSSASHEQKVALLEALKSRYQSTLGEIVSVRSAPITFRHEGKSYDVAS